MDTVDWSVEEIGVYTRLLLAEWANGPLTNDIHRLARIAGTSPKKFTHFWKNVSPKFVPNGDGKLCNLRLEKTREEQANYSESRRKNVSGRYKDKATCVDTHDPTYGLHNACSSSSTSSSLKKKKERIKKASLPSLEYSEDFLKFYNAYPWKADKPKAFASWKAINPQNGLAEKIIQAVEAQKRTKQWSEGIGIPMPSTWLNNKRWEDDCSLPEGAAIPKDQLAELASRSERLKNV